MASDREYLEFVLEQLSLAEDIRWRPMMGEYIIYCKDRVIGGIYDNRFLIKPVKAALKLIPNPRTEIPYEGAKEMILAEDIENKAFMKELAESIAAQLPLPKAKRKKRT